MLDSLKGTEQEHIEHYWIPSETECIHSRSRRRYSCGGKYQDNWEAPVKMLASAPGVVSNYRANVPDNRLGGLVMRLE